MNKTSKPIYKTIIYLCLILFFAFSACIRPPAANHKPHQPLGQKGSVDNMVVDINAFDSYGMTPLHLAASNGETEMVRLLIKAGADVNLATTDKESWMAIHFAVKYGDLKMVELLLEAGASIDVPTHDGLYPIHIAAQYGKKLILKRLIGSGANVNQMTSDSEPWAPIHYAIRNGHFKTAQILIDAKADPQLMTQDKDPWAPIQLAARYGSTKIVDALLEAGANPNVMDQDNYAPIHLAVRYGDYGMTKLLIDHGAQINVFNNYGWHPIHYASRYNKFAIVNLLLKKGVDPDILTKDKAPWNALLFATWYGNSKIAKALLEAGANPEFCDQDGWCPLHIALRYNMPEIAHVLLKAGAGINVKTKDGWTPLHLAIRYGRKDLAQRLIDSGANVNAKNEEQWSPLHFATRYGDTEIVKALLARNADPNAYNSAGKAPIHLACRYVKDAGMVKGLIDAGVDVNSLEKNKEPWAPIHYATCYNNSKVLDLLLKANAKVNIKNSEGWCPIHYAVRYGDSVMLKSLIKAGADPNVLTEDKTPWAPIHLAARYGGTEMVKILADAGARLNVKTIEKNPWSPLEFAINYGHADMVDVLLNPTKAYKKKEPEPLSEQSNNALTLFLWKLEEKNSVLYFYGSFHYGTKGIYPLDKRIYDAYNASNILVVENNLIKKPKDSTLKEVSKKGRLNKEESLNDYLSSAQQEQFNALLEEYGMSIDDFKTMRPWVCYLQLSSLDLKNNGYNPTIGIDMHFLRKAVKDKKEIKELETKAEQVSFLSDMPVKDLLKTMQTDHQLNASIGAIMNELITLWKEGATEQFGKAFLDLMKNEPDYQETYNILLKQRNKRWMEKIEDMIDDGETYFIVVGAAHLAGEGNLIQLLSKAEHKVSQL